MGVQSSVGAREQIDRPIKGESVGKRSKVVGPTFRAAEPEYYVNDCVFRVMQVNKQAEVITYINIC